MNIARLEDSTSVGVWGILNFGHTSRILNARGLKMFQRSRGRFTQQVSCGRAGEPPVLLRSRFPPFHSTLSVGILPEPPEGCTLSYASPPCEAFLQLLSREGGLEPHERPCIREFCRLGFPHPLPRIVIARVNVQEVFETKNTTPANLSLMCHARIVSPRRTLPWGFPH